MDTGNNEPFDEFVVFNDDKKVWLTVDGGAPQKMRNWQTTGSDDQSAAKYNIVPLCIPEITRFLNLRFLNL